MIALVAKSYQPTRPDIFLPTQQSNLRITSFLLTHPTIGDLYLILLVNTIPKWTFWHSLTIHLTL